MSSRDASTESEFARRAEQVFRRHLADLDDITRAKLRAARLRAVRDVTPRLLWAWASPRWITAGAFGALAAAIVGVWLISPGPANQARARFDVADSSDLELLLGDEDFDMVQNLEFYAWLEEQTQADSKPAKSAADDKSG